MNNYFFDHPQLPLVSDKDISKLPIVTKYEALFAQLNLFWRILQRIFLIYRQR